MEKLNVCLLSDSFPPIIDGVANAVVNYAKNIKKHGGYASVVTPSYPDAQDTGYPFRVLRYPSIDVRKNTTGYMAGIPFSPELSAHLMKQNVDILHAHAPMMSALLTRVLRKRIDAPTIITYHTKYDIDITNVVKSKPLQVIGIKSVVNNINTFDEVWVVSRGAGENLKSMGFQGDYYVMPNGVDFTREPVNPSLAEKVASGYDLPAGVPLYFYAGRLMWYKGFRITLDALKKLRDLGQDFRMVIVGDGGDADEIKAYTRTLGLSDRVFFAGAVFDREQLKAWYTRADLFLFPSTFDSNGLVVREAAACNLPSVLIRNSCAAENTQDDRNAFLISENAESMLQLLQKLNRDPEHVRQVGIRSGEELYLSWENAVLRAMDRYHVVQEIYKSGGFSEHTTFSDNLLATQGDLMYTIGQIGKALNQGKIIAKYITRKNTRTIKYGANKNAGTRKNNHIRNNTGAHPHF